MNPVECPGVLVRSVKNVERGEGTGVSETGPGCPCGSWRIGYGGDRHGRRVVPRRKGKKVPTRVIREESLGKKTGRRIHWSCKRERKGPNKQDDSCVTQECLCHFIVGRIKCR